MGFFSENRGGSLNFTGEDQHPAQSAKEVWKNIQASILPEFLLFLRTYQVPLEILN